MEMLELLRNKSENNQIELLDDRNYIFPSTMCNMYKQIRLGHRPFFNKPLTNQMPIGYTILLNENVEQFERFLMAIYHPNNMYCVHVDVKSSDSIKKGVKSIVDCFDNVFIATKLESVMWGNFTFLKAQMNCMTDLVNLTNLINNHENLMGKRIVNWE